MEYIQGDHEVSFNSNGGSYVQGRRYTLAKKSEVLQVYLDLISSHPTKAPTAEQVATLARVSTKYAWKVIQEFRIFGVITDPKKDELEYNKNKGPHFKIGPEAGLFLLSLRAENDQRTLPEYCKVMYDELGLSVSHTTVHRFFFDRFDYQGKLKKPNLVPLDKWKEENIIRYQDFISKINQLPNHNQFHFLDEKHIVNKDCVGNRVRADPLTGQVRCIHVSGNFRFAYNLIAIISPNPMKQYPVNFIIGQDNGTAASFTAYIERLITIGWFEHGDVLILDNAAIHSGAEAEIVEEILWNTEINGKPLRTLVVYLPTRSPELNPIELVFHILARRLRSLRCRVDDPELQTVPIQAQRVLNGMSTELIRKCCRHCGYNTIDDNTSL